MNIIFSYLYARILLEKIQSLIIIYSFTVFVVECVLYAPSLHPERFYNLFLK